MDDLYNSTIEIVRSNDNASIFRVYPDLSTRKFIAGQYGSLGLKSDNSDKLVKRAYSISSSMIDIDTKTLQDQNDLNYLEFYINRVPLNNKKREQITPKLFNINNGDRIFCGNKIVGHYIFQKEKKWKNILLISTHTGESPNNSIVNQLLINKEKINICNINVGINWKSLYSEEHSMLKKIFHNYNFIQFSDKSHNYENLMQYIKNFCDGNETESKGIGFNFNNKNTLVMLCGDPIMIGAPIKKGAWEYVYPEYGLVNIFKKYSLELTTRFKQGEIIHESYW